MSSKEDVRDNVIQYDDEGGGEEDTRAFDIGTLRRPRPPRGHGYGRGVLLHLAGCPGDVQGEGGVKSPDVHLLTSTPRDPTTPSDLGELLQRRLEERRGQDAAPAYDSMATFAYEGGGSRAGSLSPPSDEASWGALDIAEDFSYLGDWGQPFKTLASLLDTHQS